MATALEEGEGEESDKGDRVAGAKRLGEDRVRI